MIEIENFVRQKKNLKAKKLIVQWLRQNPNSTNYFLAAQWYRRLSLYQDALRLVLRLNPFDSGANRLAKILAAEIFSHIGNVSYALQIVSEMSPETLEEHDIFAGIYFSANMFDKASEILEVRLRDTQDQTDYSCRLAKLSYADSLAKLGMNKRAIAICHDILNESTEVLLVAICKQAMGEYFARMKNYNEALRWLLMSKDIFPPGNSFDHVLLNRWIGYVYGKLNQPKKAKDAFQTALKITKDVGLGDDVLLENLRLEAKVNLLPAEERNRLPFFPQAFTKPDSNSEIKPLKLGKRQSLLQILFSSDEFVSNGKSWLGLPLEIKLIGYLRIVGNLGVSFETIKSVFWPEEGRTYLHLEARIRQMLKRIKRRYGIGISTKRKRLFMTSKDLQKVFVEISFKQKPPRKLSTTHSFTRDQLEDLYNLSKAQACRKLNDLVDQKLIKRLKAGKGTCYAV